MVGIKARLQSTAHQYHTHIRIPHTMRIDVDGHLADVAVDKISIHARLPQKLQPVIEAQDMPALRHYHNHLFPAIGATTTDAIIVIVVVVFVIIVITGITTESACTKWIRINVTSSPFAVVDSDGLLAAGV